MVSVLFCWELRFKQTLHINNDINKKNKKKKYIYLQKDINMKYQVINKIKN